MPSWREMRADIPTLAALLLRRQVDGNGGGGAVPTLSAEAAAALQRYDFPGNVRELENILERALALASDDEITEEDLGLSGGARDIADAAADMSHLSLPEKLESIERQAIVAALEQTRYNRTAAAKLLGVSFRALRYRMERLGIKDELDAKG